MKENPRPTLLAVVLLLALVLLASCSKDNSGKIEIELLQYKPEAANYFAKVEERFNATHDDIHLTISSPNDAMTVLKTRFIREDFPDIIGIGGDVNFSNFVDKDMLMDISDYEGLKSIKASYKQIDKDLEYVPLEGIYAVPYVANAAGILYNKAMFDEHGWTIPETWEEFLSLCEDIQAAGILPLYFGFRETWTCLAPWNALAVGLVDSDVCRKVNSGSTTFTAEYRETAEKMYQMLQYGPDNPFAYDYTGACTAFARGEAAMYPIGSYAIPQIRSVNPDIVIDSFAMPANSDEKDNKLNSGIDLQFSVLAGTKHKEAAYKVLDFLLEDENLLDYISDQIAVPCKDGDYALPDVLDGMTSYIRDGRMADYQDHYYPSEMAVDAQIQTFLINGGDVDAFLAKFDSDWLRYNRDVIALVQKYTKEHGAL